MGQMIFGELLGNAGGGKTGNTGNSKDFKLPTPGSKDKDITNLMSQYNVEGMQAILDLLNPKPLGELPGQMQPLGGNDALSQLINAFLKNSGS